MTFITNKNGTFNPSILTSDVSVATWSVTGESDQTTNSPSFTLTGADETVTLTIADFSKITDFKVNSQNVKGSLDISLLTGCDLFWLFTNPLLTSVTNPINATTINTYAISSCNLTSLDLTSFTNFGGNFQCNSNTNLSSLSFPSSNKSFTHFWANSCAFTSLNLSMLTGFGGDVNLHTNSLMTSITFPTSSTIITDFNIYSTGLTSLGVSGLTALSGQFMAYNNSSLTSITLPVTSGIITRFQATNCNLTGTLDLSNLTLSTNIYLFGNSLLTDVIFPTTSNNFTNIQIYSCAIGVLNWSALAGTITLIRIENNAMSTTEVNTTSLNIDTFINWAASGTSYNIAGTNAAHTVGPPDGLAAIASLITKVTTVTYN